MNLLSSHKRLREERLNLNYNQYVCFYGMHNLEIIFLISFHFHSLKYRASKHPFFIFFACFIVTFKRPQKYVCPLYDAMLLFFRVTDPLQFTTFALTSRQRQSNSISKQKPKLIITEDLGSRHHYQDKFQILYSTLSYTHDPQNAML